MFLKPSESEEFVLAKHCLLAPLTAVVINVEPHH